MKSGPKPKPTARRKLEGNPGKRPYNVDEPELPTLSVDFDRVPDVLAGDPVAAAEWARLAPLLRTARIVTEADRNALVAACQQWSLYQDALAQAPPHRRVLRTPNDYPIPNPYIPMAAKALMHCERLWDALGLTPSARTRVAAAKTVDDDDAFAEFDRPRAARLPRVTRGPSLLGRMQVDEPERPQ